MRKKGIWMTITETDLTWECALSSRRKTKRIIIRSYHGAVHSRRALTALHASLGADGFGFHFLVTETGEVLRGRPLDTEGNHTPGKNADSIGILLDGDLLKKEPSELQLEALMKLVGYLMDEYPTIDGLIKYNE